MCIVSHFFRRNVTRTFHDFSSDSEALMRGLRFLLSSSRNFGCISVQNGDNPSQDVIHLILGILRDGSHAVCVRSFLLMAQSKDSRVD